MVLKSDKPKSGHEKWKERSIIETLSKLKRWKQILPLIISTSSANRVSPWAVIFLNL